MKQIPLSSLKPVPLAKFTPFQRRWLRALTSNKFEQGSERLVTKLKDEAMAYCCLGVACKVLQKDLGLKFSAGNGAFDENPFTLPPKAIRALKSRSDNGSFNENINGGLKGLTELNDSGVYGFTKIADIIRRAPWVFFKNFRPRKSVIILED